MCVIREPAVVRPDGRAYNHPEAFCLMTYRCEDCGVEEVLWNSRDGVTPYIISCSKCPGVSGHINFQDDRYTPNHFPKSSDRVFVDLTQDRYEIYTRARVRKFWDADYHEFRKCYGSKEAAFEVLSSTLINKGEPDVMVIR